jgi:DNA cross-link repair 1C protein
MSTFDGKIEEIPGISVDEFVDNQAKVYFLSHCHTDHMNGLSALKTEAPVYTTSISALFIRKKCPQLENVRILELGLATQVQFTQNDETPLNVCNFVVTAISAGHCAGSCMLLFQIEGCDILYTGDFRISLRNAQNVKLLKEIKNSSNSVVYLDSTFLKKTFPCFPSQTESVTKILEIVENFLKKSMNHKGKSF